MESRGHCIPVPMLGSCNQIPGNICRCRGNHEAATVALACFLPASAAVAATATLPERYCNDRDTSCAAWGKAGECTGSNSELVKG